MSNINLVIGGGSGIGKAVAEQLLHTSQTVFVADLNLAAWENTDAPNLITFPMDVQSHGSLNELIAHLSAQQFRIKGLVFTVGRAFTLPLQSIKPEMTADLLKLNTISLFEIIGLLLNADLFCPSSASIVVISSIVGQTGAKGKIAYATTKGAIDAGIKSLACELAPQNIRINAVAPGTLQTPMLTKLIATIGSEEVEKLAADYPLGLGLPEDVANLVHFLLSEQAPWISGTVLTIDGGFSAR